MVTSRTGYGSARPSKGAFLGEGTGRASPQLLLWTQLSRIDLLGYGRHKTGRGSVCPCLRAFPVRREREKSSRCSEAIGAVCTRTPHIAVNTMEPNQTMQHAASQV